MIYYQLAFFISLALAIAVVVLSVNLSKAKSSVDQFRSLYWKYESKYNKETADLKAILRRQKNDLHSLSEEYSKHKQNLQKLLESNLTSAPWLAGMMADFLTYDLEVEAKKLDWGSNITREKKVASIRAIRAEAERRIEEAKYSSYQLAYLLQLYPQLSDILDADYSELDCSDHIPEGDPVRGWLTKEEWNALPEDTRNQLALDRYIDSRSKSKWQIGRDYELSVAYEYEQNGFSVENSGSYLKYEDMGRDLIAIKGDKIYIIQCKYWSEKKMIHEKHIFQLYGTTISYRIENPDLLCAPIPVFVTNIRLSPKARQVADYLHVKVVENHLFKEFPRIKCNIGRDEFGPTKIYHLPMDDQYDKVKICNPGECYAFTVKEAVSKGFRRAYKWHGNP